MVPALAVALALHGAALLWAAAHGLSALLTPVDEGTIALTLARPAPPLAEFAAPAPEEYEIVAPEAPADDELEPELVETESWGTLALDAPSAPAQPAAPAPLASVDLTPPDLFALGDLGSASNTAGAPAPLAGVIGAGSGGAPGSSSPGTLGGTGSGAGGDGRGSSAGVPGGPGVAPAVAVRIQPPALLDAPKMEYPPAARRRGEQGVVACRLHVSERGAVTAVEVIETSGHASLDEAARTALLTWRYRPELRDGRPVATTTVHRVVFRLETR